MVVANLNRNAKPTRYFIVRIRQYPKGPDPYGADVKGGPVAGRGTTPDGAVRSLRKRLINSVRLFGLPGELAAATLDRETILTWLPGAFTPQSDSPNGFRLQAVTWDLRGVVAALDDDELGARARALTLDQFEDGFLHDFPAGWEQETAEAFNRWLSTLDGHPAKPVVFDIRKRCSLLGEHTAERVWLKPGLSPLKTWQVFLHELAHYRVTGHRLRFALELVRVYGLWRRWDAGQGCSRADSYARTARAGHPSSTSV